MIRPVCSRRTPSPAVPRATALEPIATKKRQYHGGSVPILGYTWKASTMEVMDVEVTGELAAIWRDVARGKSALPEKDARHGQGSAKKQSREKEAQAGQEETHCDSVNFCAAAGQEASRPLGRTTGVQQAADAGPRCGTGGASG
jgi:hypothetical protein